MSTGWFGLVEAFRAAAEMSRNCAQLGVLLKQEPPTHDDLIDLSDLCVDAAAKGERQCSVSTQALARILMDYLNIHEAWHRRAWWKACAWLDSLFT